MERKRCLNCRFYEVYYIKGTTKFYREKLGKCSRFGEVKKTEENCINWQRKYSAGRKELNRETAFNYVKKITVDLSMIAQILSEDCREERENAEQEGQEE